MPTTSFDAPPELITELDHYVADSDELQYRSEAIRQACRELVNDE